jgi:hypothetical protein
VSESESNTLRLAVYQKSVRLGAQAFETRDQFLTIGLLIYTLDADIWKTSGAQQWIYVNRKENNSCSLVVFTARCIQPGIISLLPANSLSRIVLCFTQ